MAFVNCDDRPPVTLQLDAVDLDAIVRILIDNPTKPEKIRDRLDWFYRVRRVPRPEERSLPPTNVVPYRQLGLKRLARAHGPVVATMVDQRERACAAGMLEIVMRLESELEITERIAAKRAAKRAEKAKAKGKASQAR